MVLLYVLEKGDTMYKYGDDFDGLLDIIKDKLYSINIDEEYASMCLQTLSDISAKVNESNSQEVYNWAIDSLYVILDELKQFEQTQDDYYAPITMKKDEKELIEFIDSISNNIDGMVKEDRIANKQRIVNELKRLMADIKKHKNNIRLARLKVISSLLTLSLLISVPINAFMGIKKKTEYKTIYPTIETIYDTETSYEYDLEYYQGKPVVGNILSYSNEELEYYPVGENGYVLREDGYHNCYYEIIERTPWTIIDREAVRKVRTCIIPVNELGNVIDLDNFDSMFITYNGTEEKEIILKNEVPRSDRKFYSEEENKDKNTYQVIKYDQNLNNPITVSVPNDYSDVYVIMMTELLIWISIVEMSHGLITESIIKSLKSISENKKITKEQKIKLDQLYKSYVKKYQKKKQKTKRKNKNK